MIWVDFIYNIAPLIALSVISGFVDSKWKKNTWLGVLFQGVVFGGVAVVGMLRPFVFAPGLIFDGRSVLISLGGLFFGPWAAAVACLMTIPIRLVQGGPGAVTGVLVILSSAAIGVSFYMRRKQKSMETSFFMLILFGLVVHLAMLAMMFTLPTNMILPVLKRISLPVMLIYPLATVLIGKIIFNQFAQAKLLVALRENRANEERYRELVENANSVIIRWRRDGTIVFFNEYAQKFFGYGLNEAIGKHVNILAPPKDSTGRDMSLLVQDIIEYPDRYSNNINENICSDGRRVWLAWTNKAIFDDKGQVVEILAVGLDITDRKKAEDKLRKSEEKFRVIFDNASDGILLADAKTKKIYIGNNKICQMLGYSFEEIKRMEVFDIHSKENLPYVIEQFEKQKRREITLSKDLPVKRKDGSVFYADVNSSPITLDENEYLLGIFRDVTERKRAELELQQAYKNLKDTQAQLIQSNKMSALGQLASGVAHELNNPLTGVLNNVQLIKLEAEANKDFNLEDFKDLLDAVEKSALRCKKISQSLLDFTHIGSTAFTPISINDIASKTIELINHELKLQNIVFKQEFQPDLPMVQGNSQLLQQVFFGIFVNAKWAIEKKTKDGGAITVKTSQNAQARTIDISISDTGIGISQENMLKLFTPFFTTKDVGEGTGLGLAIFYNIIKSHNGDIRLESQVGVGTTVLISLPY